MKGVSELIRTTRQECRSWGRFPQGQGIALGPLAQELLNLIKDTTVKIIHFRKYLQKLQSTLETLIPLIEIAEKMKDRPKTHIQEMRVVLEKGKELVIKCSNVRTTNYFKRWWYSKKILNLEQDLLQFFQMIVPADTLRIVLMILAEAKERESSESGFACVVPVPDTTFGLDSPMEKLKHQLLFEKDVRIIGLCAAGGSGKTTLAAKLCRDEDVKGMKF
ncbi:protein DA1-related 5-like isoform X2 [Macadamia integrifolia]|uniref:protein DA1-related 5-like isoform X2 n=1 Tax=Macadamia integrifolia TaxID=60698 RepID=UPI001C4F1A65|nr:protein DA1-related 5-like isoform X2 [Macadamia integrifolia]